MPRHEKPPQLKRLRDDSLINISDSLIAGRHASCGIDLSQEEGASRKHARFNISDGQLTITDLGSLNGTLVNGHEIDGKHVLKNSDIIVFDTEKYLLSVPPMLRPARKPLSSTSDTVIANKAERNNPASIAPAIKVLATENHQQPVEIQHDNTVEYLNSLPAPDMKRPVGMPEKTRTKKRPALVTKKLLLPLVVLLVLFFIAYQLGSRAA